MTLTDDQKAKVCAMIEHWRRRGCKTLSEHTAKIAACENDHELNMLLADKESIRKESQSCFDIADDLQKFLDGKMDPDKLENLTNRLNELNRIIKKLNLGKCKVHLFQRN